MCFEPTFLATLLPPSFPEEAHKVFSLLNSATSPFASKPVTTGRENAEGENEHKDGPGSTAEASLGWSRRHEEVS